MRCQEIVSFSHDASNFESILTVRQSPCRGSSKIQYLPSLQYSYHLLRYMVRLRFHFLSSCLCLDPSDTWSSMDWNSEWSINPTSQGDFTHRGIQQVWLWKQHVCTNRFFSLSEIFTAVEWHRDANISNSMSSWRMFASNVAFVGQCCLRLLHQILASQHGILSLPAYAWGTKALCNFGSWPTQVTSSHKYGGNVKDIGTSNKIIHRNASSLLGALSAEALALEAYEACQRIEANRRDLARAWDPAMWLEVGAAIIKGLAAGNALTPRCWEQNKTDYFRLSSRPSQRRTNLLCKTVHFVTYHHGKSKCIFKRKWDVLALCTAHVSPLQKSESILRF